MPTPNRKKKQQQRRSRQKHEKETQKTRSADRKNQQHKQNNDTFDNGDGVFATKEEAEAFQQQVDEHVTKWKELGERAKSAIEKIEKKQQDEEEGESGKSDRNSQKALVSAAAAVGAAAPTSPPPSPEKKEGKKKQKQRVEIYFINDEFNVQYFSADQSNVTARFEEEEEEEETKGGDRTEKYKKEEAPASYGKVRNGKQVRIVDKTFRDAFIDPNKHTVHFDNLDHFFCTLADHPYKSDLYRFKIENENMERVRYPIGGHFARHTDSRKELPWVAVFYPSRAPLVEGGPKKYEGGKLNAFLPPELPRRDTLTYHQIFPDGAGAASIFGGRENDDYGYPRSDHEEEEEEEGEEEEEKEKKRKAKQQKIKYNRIVEIVASSEEGVGTLFVFPSVKVPHEVLPVTSGTKHAYKTTCGFLIFEEVRDFYWHYDDSIEDGEQD